MRQCTKRDIALFSCFRLESHSCLVAYLANSQMLRNMQKTTLGCNTLQETLI
jgi:hypothetical protein